MAAFMTTESEAAMQKAVSLVEVDSAVELVVALRPKSGSYAHIDLSVGIVIATLTLGFLLYCPWPVAWHFLLINPIVAGTALTLLSARIPGLQRSLSKRKTMEKSVARAARSLFVESGVHHTENRSGVLVYLSRLERTAMLVADSGVELALPKGQLQKFSTEVTSSLREGAGADKIASIIESWAEIFAEQLPAQEGDRNELADGVDQ